MLNALLVFIMVVVTNWLSTELRVVVNPLLNLFIWAAIISLFIGISTKDRLLWR